MTDSLIDKSALVRLGASPDAGQWAGGLNAGLVRTCPLSAVQGDLTASGFTVTTLPLTALGRRQDGSPKARLVLARTASTPC